ncbi:hypothetical protein KUTeg_019250 [Tegillarca granosa]|uniref:Potassium channel domain-containing protein n=1 Tax=Tegillarca granosa TaxID=220873 RepID=A0ABQ9EBZ2_TEGGR|nr:hypothetical protein KUTeg_019250 [Tegillarca granosa]
MGTIKFYDQWFHIDSDMDLGERLKRRKELFFFRKMIVQIMFTTAMFGIVLMIIETELYLRKVTSKNGLTSQIIKSIISATTVLLLMTIVFEYYVDAKIKALDMGVTSVITVMTSWNCFLFCFEIVVCSLHPFPGNFTMSHMVSNGKYADISLDAVMSFLMIARLYLVGKFITVHSWLMNNRFAVSFDAISQVKLSTLFYVKAVMLRHPFFSLILIMTSSVIVSTWAMHACRLYHINDPRTSTYMDAMWLVVISFLTLSYGEGHPRSFCRRYISVCSAFLGIISTALLVALIGKYLEQSRMERYLFNFVSRVQKSAKRKKAAAEVIKNTLSMWKSKCREDPVSSTCGRRRSRDKLTRSLEEMKQIKRDIEDMDISTIGLADVYHITENVYDRIEANVENEMKLLNRLHTLKGRITNSMVVQGTA